MRVTDDYYIEDIGLVDNLIQEEAERMYIEHSLTRCCCGATISGYKTVAFSRLTNLN